MEGWCQVGVEGAVRVAAVNNIRVGYTVLSAILIN